MTTTALLWDRENTTVRMPFLPTAIGVYFAARLAFSFLFFQSDPRAGAGVAMALNLFLFVATLFYTFGPHTVSVRSITDLRGVRWVFAFLFVSLISLLWSETVSKTVALVYWLGMAADVAMVVLLVRDSRDGTGAVAVMRGYVLGAALVATLAWSLPSMQDLRPGNDEFFSPNAIGVTCAIGVFFAQYLSRTVGGYRLLTFFLTLSIIRSLSKTTIIAFLCSQAVVLLVDQSMSRRSKVQLIGGALVVALAFSSLLIAYYNVYVNAGNQAETLTGRVGIWTLVLERSLERPWLGHGFHSFRNVIPPFGDFEAWHAHNEILQQFYAYGVLGIVLLLGVYGSLFLQGRKLQSVTLRALTYGLVCFFAVRGLGDTERFDLSLPVWAVTLLACFLHRADRPEIVSAPIREEVLG